MGKIVQGLFAVVAFIAVIFLTLIAGTLFGGLIAMLIAWVFNDTWAAVTTELDWGLSPWATGALLGFLSGFVKATQTNNNGS